MHAAFFDLDGCLVDSSAAVPRGINAGLRAIDLQVLPTAELVQFVGPPLLGTYERLIKDQGADPGLARAAIDGYRAAYATYAIEMTTVFPGIPEVLGALSERGLRLAVVTSKPKVSAVPILRGCGLLDRFEGVFGPDLDALTEAKQVGLERALSLVGRGIASERDDTVMIGDTQYDIEAGRLCGTRTVGAAWGIAGAAALVAAGADQVVREPAELFDAVVTVPARNYR